MVSVEKIAEYEDALDDADIVRTEIIVVSSEHSAGKKLLGLGGIAALLK